MVIEVRSSSSSPVILSYYTVFLVYMVLIGGTCFCKNMKTLIASHSITITYYLLIKLYGLNCTALQIETSACMHSRGNVHVNGNLKKFCHILISIVFHWQVQYVYFLKKSIKSQRNGNQTKISPENGLYYKLLCQWEYQ